LEKGANAEGTCEVRDVQKQSSFDDVVALILKFKIPFFALLLIN